MKKRILIGVSLLCGISSAFAQGTVNFSNRDLGPSPAVLVYLGSPFSGGVPLVGTNWVAQLYYGAPGSPESSLIPVDSPLATFNFPTTSFPGTWIGGTRTLAGFFNNGGVNDPKEVVLQVRVRDSAIPPCFECSPWGGLFTGKSAIFSYYIPLPGSPDSAFLMTGFLGL